MVHDEWDGRPLEQSSSALQDAAVGRMVLATLEDAGRWGTKMLLPVKGNRRARETGNALRGSSSRLDFTDGSMTAVETGLFGWGQ